MKSLQDYPEILGVKHIQEILDIGRDRAYEIFKIKGFPALHCVGRKKRVRKEAFERFLIENPAVTQ